MSQNSVYAPLPDNSFHVRLLDILPGSQSDQIRCNLTTFKLDSSLNYTALSYTWGTEDPSLEIFINGCVFAVRPNLKAALKQLQQKNDKDIVRIWIDAICINQNDILERNAQVALMHRIYGEAQGVLVWLGEELEESQMDYEIKPHRAWKPHDPEKMKKLEAKWYSPTMKSTYQLIGRAWWKRIWVVQEVTMANAVLGFCGEKRVNWNSVVHDLEELRMTVEALGDLGKLIPRVVETVDDAFSIQQTRRMVQCDTKDERPELIDLLVRNRYRDATDPRDKVFGLLNIAKDGFNAELRADYSLSVEQVYSNVAAHLMKKNGMFHVLAHSRSFSRRLGLPSWAPDWSSTKGADRLIDPIALELIKYRVQQKIPFPHLVMP